ncbi:transposase [Ezakiella coagulans]|uniref:transposase n=1 Tax=Ezakiella coagulans TaxID=46507 RepID=UPI003CCC265E
MFYLSYINTSFYYLKLELSIIIYNYLILYLYCSTNIFTLSSICNILRLVNTKITNSFDRAYTNGCLEGKHNKIKQKNHMYHAKL